MELVKPDPLYINGRPHYSLSSYDPLTIVVRIPYASNEDVELALEWALTQAGGTPENLADDAWVRTHFGGIANAEQLKEMIRADLIKTNSQLSESQKKLRCLEALAERLMQRIPDSVMDQAYRSVREGLVAHLGAPGMPESLLLARMGMSKESFEEIVSAQAEQTAKGDAAISAWIDHFQLQISDEEVPRQLGVDEAQVPDFISSVRAANQWEEARLAALRNKALSELSEQSTCTYEHETEEQAKERVAQMRASQSARPNGPANSGPAGHNDHPHLKLV